MYNGIAVLSSVKLDHNHVPSLVSTPLPLQTVHSPEKIHNAYVCVCGGGGEGMGGEAGYWVIFAWQNNASIEADFQGLLVPFLP